MLILKKENKKKREVEISPKEMKRNMEKKEKKMKLAVGLRKKVVNRIAEKNYQNIKFLKT